MYRRGFELSWLIIESTAKTQDIIVNKPKNYVINSKSAESKLI
jgi:hypothetical protein